MEKYSIIKKRSLPGKSGQRPFFSIIIYQNLTTSGSCVNELKVAVAFFK